MNKTKVAIDAETLDKRVTELANEIMEDFKGESLILLCILKGSVTFLTDLGKKLDMHVEYEFMEISTYGNEKVSSGIVKINKDLTYSIKDRNVLVVEDIVDTGTTINYLLEYLQIHQPKKLKVCSLLDKPCKRTVKDLQVDYIGFVVEDEFYVGYGIDYQQQYRNLPYIAIVE